MSETDSTKFDVSRAEHPSSEELQLLFAGQLERRRREEVESHLLECNACCEQIDQLVPKENTVVEGLLRLAREAASDGTFHVSALTDPDSTAEREPVAESFPAKVGRYRIERLLGRGGFGLVYLAFDEQLQRRVALKVPHASIVSDSKHVDTILAEARTVAGLDHPGIVPVYDVGTSDNFPCYVVSKFIDGCNLSQWMKQKPLSLADAADMLATVCEAMDFAHSQGIVHRDIKPANILIDDDGRLYVADFGLALREENIGDGPKLLGTPMYMSPEQADGEGHRVDGRSDIFSLGSVLYALLAGHPPFESDEVLELLDLVSNAEPRPLRDVNPQLPLELERICAKAMSKRASDRYSTAAEFAQDLRLFLMDDEGANTRSTEGPAPASSSSALKIVPKGLRSFDSHDAEFFLQLLPGPTDRDGLPDSLRFWKTRVEETDPDNTFSIGLIYGPSGCGKSSLVKAGLLPRLSDEVMVVYIEAAPEDTESRLLRGLRKRCPAIDENQSLTQAVTSLRRGQGIPVGKKVLIVLDQFEQWLQARTKSNDSELVQALRQCDGGQVQCIVMVRDDFWMAATRFLRELEVCLVEADNAAAVDLFPMRHAEKVLAAFGRAFEALPEVASQTSKEQQQFLKQSVAGLAEDGNVICVRLALFAEMMKGRAWTPATLKQVGGTDGVGVTFLEETFSSANALPEYRYHEKAARAVLQDLLPDSGTSIKGNMRSDAELLEASGYANRLEDFDDLMRILDGERRLITGVAADDEANESSGIRQNSLAENEAEESRASQHVDESRSFNGEPKATAVNGEATADTVAFGLPLNEGILANSTTASRHYQLAHDYLVPSLREWLTRKQKETRRGRAELRLDDLAGTWNARPENRFLPSWLEHLNLRLFTDRQKWTDSQRKMMGRAARVHGIRTALAVVALALLVTGGISIRNSVEQNRQELVAQKQDEQNDAEATRLVEGLLKADTTQTDSIIESLDEYRRWADDDLRIAFDTSPDDSNAKLHAAMALLPVDDSALPFLRDRLLTVAPAQFATVRDSLADHKDDIETLADGYWSIARDNQQSAGRRFQAAAALATFDPDHEHWSDEAFAKFLAHHLITVLPSELVPWRDAMRPVRKHLIGQLSAIYQISDDKSLRIASTDVVRDYLADQPAELFKLLTVAVKEQFEPMFEKMAPLREQAIELAHQQLRVPLPDNPDDFGRDQHARQQANCAVLLLRLEAPDEVWPLLRHSEDPSTRSYLVYWMVAHDCDPQSIIDRYKSETDVTAKRALLLAMEHAEPEELVDTVLDVFTNHPDAGMHAAAQYLLRKWDRQATIDQLQHQWTKDGTRSIDWWLAEASAAQPDDQHSNWYINSQGQAYTVLDAGEFLMGVPSVNDPRKLQPRHRRRIGRRYAMCATEVTKAQWRPFSEAHPNALPFYAEMPSAYPDEKPISTITWFAATWYCNWLSETEGIPKDQWCYEPNAEDEFGPGMKAKPEFWKLGGYRLPTEAEWEFACRAGSTSYRYFGHPEFLMSEYAWHVGNTEVFMPPASLKPNDFGLFDMLGNMHEWVYDAKYDYPTSATDVFEDTPGTEPALASIRRNLRGSSYNSKTKHILSAQRGSTTPVTISTNFGFRPVRTLTTSEDQ